MSTNPSYSNSPNWWSDDHESRWDRVKAAVHRDWGQTKADLTGGRKGEDLNQNIGDTMGQAFGKGTVPAEGTPNPMDADELARHVKRAEKQMDRVVDRLASDTEKAIKRDEKETRAEAKDAAKDQKMALADGRGKWEDAERPLRYGHGAARQYGPDWTDDAERAMRDEWTGLYPDQQWDQVRETVRLGWYRGQP